MTQPNTPLTPEMAHVLFVDIVGSSLLLHEEQAARKSELHELVRGTSEFGRASAQGELVCRQEGDGVALVFFRDPLAPARFVMELARVLRDHPRIQLRTGIHSGPVSRTQDIAGIDDVSGGGINVAKRVVDCAEPGQVLISATYAELIAEFQGWPDRLRDLGERTVKHDRPVHVFELDVNVPEAAEAPSKPEKVAVVYRRNAKPDDYVLELLEHLLRSEGYEVFIDRHMSIGVEWAQEIESQIRTSDAVIPLISEASIASEMMEYEIRSAYDASQKQHGRPRLLPVRVNFTGPLPDSLSYILDPLQYALYRGPEDDEKLVEEILHSLRNPPEQKPKVSREKLEPVGGGVPLDSEFYIERPVDSEFRTAIARGDSIVLVKGARQVGKTSLLARGLQQAREAGHSVVFTDLQPLNESHLSSADNLFIALAYAMVDQLGLDVDPASKWVDALGPNPNSDRFLRRFVLEAIPANLVWGLDEVDRLFGRPFASEIFGLFRSWHNKRAVDPSGPWSRLTLAIAYATEAHLFITDLNQSPFNVGTRMSLDDFSLEEVAELNRRYGSPLPQPAGVAHLHKLVGGQPYLVRRALDALVTQATDLAGLESHAHLDSGLFGDHLRRILVSLSKDPELTDVMRGAIRGSACPSVEGFYRLRAAGVVVGDSPGEARPRCELYRRYLEHHLL